MGYTHHDKVSGINGLAVGNKGSETVVADSDAYLYQQGTKLTTSADKLNSVAGIIGDDGDIELEDTVWGDLNFDPDRSSGPAVSLPDYVTINNVIHREFTSSNNQLCGGVEEVPHDYKLSTNIYPHIHIFLKSGESAGTTGVTFTFYWELRTSAATTSGNVELSATSAELSANGNLITISDATGFSGASDLGSQVALTIARTAGNAGDIIVTSYGVHYEKDSIGSDTITTK